MVETTSVKCITVDISTSRTSSAISGTSNPTKFIMRIFCDFRLPNQITVPRKFSHLAAKLKARCWLSLLEVIASAGVEYEWQRAFTNG